MANIEEANDLDIKTSEKEPGASGPNALGTNALGTLATSVYDRLRRDILDGSLTPGLKLRVSFVRERYDAGNSPVREALNRLSSEGLVQRHDQRGFSVATASVSDLLELTDTRSMLEEMALRSAIANRTMEWEEGMVLALHRLGRLPNASGKAAYTIDPEWEHAHRLFHISLLASCGSKRLLRFCEDLSDQAYRYRQLAVEAISMRPSEYEEHKAIMDAALENDADKAVGLLAAHYRTTADILLEKGLVDPVG